MNPTELSQVPEAPLNATTGAEVQIKGVLEYRDAEGNIIKQVPFSSSNCSPVETAGE